MSFLSKSGCFENLSINSHLVMQNHSAGLTINQLSSMLRWRIPTILNIALLVFLGTLITVFLMPKKYTSSADLYIEFRFNDLISGRQFPAMLDESYVQTQLDIIRSPKVIDRVIDRLGLLQQESKPDARQNLSTRIVSSIEIQPRKSSRIFEIRYTANSPEEARDYLNALLKSFFEANQEINSGPAKSRLEQYNAQLDLMRSEIDSIQKRLTSYQQTVGIIDSDERSDMSSRQLIELTNKSVALQSQRQEISAKANVLSDLIRSGLNASEIPEIAQQPRITELKLRLADVERSLAELSGVYGKNHPKIIALLDDRKSIMQTLSREASAALDAIRLDSQKLLFQEKAVTQDLSSLQKTMLEMKKHRDVINSYQRQLESAQRIYNAALQKYDEILMQSNVANTSVSVLREAQLPTTHSKPKRANALIIGMGMGLLLGLMISFLMELTHRRVRCTDDIERDLGLTILGQIGFSRS